MAQVAKHGQCFITPEGGVAVYLTNRTMGASVKGMLVGAHISYNNAFYENSPSDLPIGVVYESGIEVGRECLIVFTGRAQVLLEDSTAGTAGSYVFPSTLTGGRADASSIYAVPGPGLGFNHVVGRSLEEISAGANVLCWIMIQLYGVGQA